MKKKLRRSMLRVASKDEEAFRGTLGAFEAFYRLGLRTNYLSVAMVARPVVPGANKESAAVTVCSPAIVVKHGANATTYRLDNHTITGTAEQCEKRWREWIF
jgi:hypothetical protein